MKKIKIISLIVSAMVLTAMSSGCQYFWPDDGNNKVDLPPAVIAAKNTYFSEPVKLGSVIKTNKITMAYESDISKFSAIVSRDQLALFEKGDKGTVSVYILKRDDPYYDKYFVYDAEVTSAAKFANDKFYVEVTGNYDKKTLLGATSGEFTAVVSRKDNVIAVPKTIIKKFYQKNIVGVLKDGVHEDREVKVGLEGDDTVEIVSGLSVGELVVFK